jgi:uncharacterized protein (DUF433 family)
MDWHDPQTAIELLRKAELELALQFENFRGQRRSYSSIIEARFEGCAVNRPTVSDIREMPLYSAADAAHFLRIPLSTARAWSFGQPYRPVEGQRRFEAVIAAADRKDHRLSFINLVELSVLATIRRLHSVPLPKVRTAMNYLRKKFPSPHPLADNDFKTNGVDLFVEKVGQLVNISKEGQVEMKDLIQAYLRGIQRDSKGIPIKLPLPIRDPLTQQPSKVVIDPSRGFGRPVVDGIGVRTEVVVERFRAGEGIASLAQDYALAADVVEDVIRLAA